MPTHSPVAATRSIGARVAGAPPWLVIAIAGLIVMVYAFPGQMTQDSWDHLTEARKGVYTDGHPPAINSLFRWLDYVIAGPFLWLVLQNVTLLVGLSWLLRVVFSARGAAWATLGLVVFPPVMMPMAVIWKDSLMAGCFVLAAGALFSGGRRAHLLALFACFVASAVRYNAFAATLPLIVLWFQWRPNQPWLARYAIAIAAWLAITLAAFGVNRALTDKPMYIWHSSLAVYDIVGTLSHSDGELSDAELEQQLAGTDLLIHRDIHKTMRTLYRPDNFLPIVQDAKLAMWALPISGFEPAPARVRDAVARAWWDVITSRPVAYLEHRLAVMGEVLSIGRARTPGAVIRRDAFHWPAYANQMGQGTGWSKLQGKWTRALTWIWRATPVFEPWIYLVLAVVLVPLARRQRDTLTVLLSGLVFESTLLLLAPSTDYRYSHWLVLSTCIATVMVMARRIRAGREQRPIQELAT